jgi:hypothetical protein
MTELLSHALRALTLWTGSGVADCADTSPDMWIRWSELKPLILRCEALEARLDASQAQAEGAISREINLQHERSELIRQRDALEAENADLKQRAGQFERTAVILADENERLMTHNANLKKVLYGAGPDETAIVQAMIDGKPNK